MGASFVMQDDDDICLDLSLFKKTIALSRKIDDNLIPRLNAETDRGRHTKEACTELLSALQSAFKQRENLINRCVKVINQEIGTSLWFIIYLFV